jgi:hypothetical protein
MLDHHDMVMVGYRGVDGPVSLQCPEVVETLRRLDDPLTDASVRAIGEALSAAHRRLRDEGVDVRRYSVEAVVEDVEAASAALGYGRIHLSSASHRHRREGTARHVPLDVRPPDAPPLLDSFVAAEGGGLSGLGAMAAQWKLMVPGMNWGDIYAKTWSTLADPERLPAGGDGGEGTIVGAPLARLAWGPAPYTSWPRAAAPRRWLEARAIPVKTLFVTGENDVGTGTVESQLVPRFVDARVVRLPGMSHAEVTSRQLEAAARLEGRFYLEGVVGDSAYVEEPLEFSPAPAFRDLGRQYARFPWAFKAFFFFKRLAD